MSSAAAAAATGAAGGAWAGPVGMAAGALVGAAGSYLSGQSAADYAERSYKHRYRWMVNDLQKAGLNPMLAVSQGPGSPPQPDFPNVGEGALKGIEAAQSARLMAAQLSLAQESADTTRAQGSKAMAEGEATEIANTIARASPLYQDALKAQNEFGAQGPSALASERFGAELTKVKNEGAKIAADTKTVDLVNKIQAAELTKAEAQARYADEIAELERRYRKAMTEAAEAGIPAAKAEAAFWEQAGPAGKLLQFLKALIGGGVAPVVIGR